MRIGFLRNQESVVMSLKKSSATLWLTEYLKNNRIPTGQVAEDTGILEEKLLIGTTKTLNATEFLTLCAYLNIKPEEVGRSSAV